jgi:light-regulated signal transduction histidine kinase (bacteriophytochrome)
LRALSGFSNILLKEYAKELPQDVQRYLGLIESSSNKMRRLIEELLKFSRTGKQDLSIKKVNCTELVKQLMGEFKEESENRGVEMVIGNLPACQADPALLTQLFINLISNAFKFTKGNKNARIEVGSKIINQGETIYFVKDNGVGFNMHYADKLFGVFQRLHSEAEYPGTGVGLAIVQRIITRHGGKVWAEAELGNGAAFYFTIGENNGKDRIY